MTTRFNKLVLPAAAILALRVNEIASATSTTYAVTINAATSGDFQRGPASGDVYPEIKKFAMQSNVTHIRLARLTTFGASSHISKKY